MSKITETFVSETAAKIEFTKKVPASLLRGSVFRHYGFDDPVGLCDGGDYMQEITIRIENEKGDIYLSIKPLERGEWWHGEISWKEFFALLMQIVKNNNKFKYHEH